MNHEVSQKLLSIPKQYLNNTAFYIAMYLVNLDKHLHFHDSSSTSYKLEYTSTVEYKI